MDVINGEGQADRCGDAGNPERQQARRDDLAGKRARAYGRLTFGAERRWVSR
jgi:hypothetical protein